MDHDGQNFIDGKRSSLGDRILSSSDAQSGEALPYLFWQAAEKAEQACLAARRAFAEYRSTSAEQRAVFLEAIADELDALDDAFIRLVMQETALPEARIRGERARTSGQMRLFARVLQRGDFTLRALTAPCRTESRLRAGSAPVPNRHRPGCGVWSQ